MNGLLNSPATLLFTYSMAAFLAALAGGALPSLFQLTHTRLQTAVSFVAGLMLGLALAGLLPHSAQQLGSIQAATWWMIAGFLVMFAIQRFLPFHHHDVAEDVPPGADKHACLRAQGAFGTLDWIGVALGLSLHSVFDGLALASAVVSGAHGHGQALGLGAALAVVLHKPFGALAITTLMTANGTVRVSRRLVNWAFALITPLGALLFFLGAEPWARAHPAWLGGMLAFCSGTFLCIACTDLLPELQFHKHDRLLLTTALILGVAVAIVINRFGHVHHDHERTNVHYPPSITKLVRARRATITPERALAPKPTQAVAQLASGLSSSPHDLNGKELVRIHPNHI